MKNILIIGDIVGRCGRELIFEKLPEIKKEYNIDFAIVNGENATTGNGITEKYAYMLLEAGADCITLGNHAFDKKDLYNMLETSKEIVRPLNVSPDLPGDGVTVIEKDTFSVAVINLMGTTYIETKLSNPFTVLEKAVANVKAKYGVKNIIVDFHAEATSEKQALAYLMDGEITALFGTHTHVQTNDIRILKNGTGYITDVGMTGAENSVIGLEKEIAIARFKDGDKGRFKWSALSPMINGCVFTVDEETGKTVMTELIYRRY
ncbi:MAG: TIGR00282 family metallophosphoesterase [Ruminococcaceae bacterium]|nr:TIGR00282 family metallophosphoesterase [Oscillospiraceae bacterium]